MRVLTLIGLLLSVAISTAQSVKDLKPGTQAYRAVVDAAGKRLKKQMGFRIGNTLDVVRIWGDLAFVFDRLESTSGSQQDYEFACVLRRVKGKWRATSSTIGQGARHVISSKSNAPKELFRTPPPKPKSIG